MRYVSPAKGCAKTAVPEVEQETVVAVVFGRIDAVNIEGVLNTHPVEVHCIGKDWIEVPSAVVRTTENEPTAVLFAE